MEGTLERSVLERKEREELATIATALGMKPSGRSKKETLIDQILKTAGVVETPAADAKPKRGPGRRPAEAQSLAAAAAPVASPEPTLFVADGAPDAPVADNGGRPRRGPKPKTNRNGRPAAGGRGNVFDPFADAESSPSTPYSDDDEASWAFAAAPKAETKADVVVPSPAELSDGADNGSRPLPAGDAGDGRPRFRNDRPDRGPRPERNDRGDRPDRGPRPDRSDRPDRGPRPDRPDRGPQASSSFDNGFETDRSGRKRRRRGRDRDRQVTPQADAFADRASESYAGELIPIAGLLDLADQGFGYIRANGYLPGPNDVYVPVNRVRQLGLRKGDRIVGSHRPAMPQEKFPAIVDIDTVNGHHPDVAKLRPKFEDLTPLFPDVKLRLEQPGQPGNMVARIIDLVSPIGKGQRGLIVSPPKAGKTTIMKQIASSIESNNPDVHLMVLLIDERPEEVTDMRRHVQGEVIASTFDKPADEHTIVAELALDRAKRLVEEGKDVVIILDGITRLARAYNLAAPATGRIMSGGIDTGALYPPKKFFGAARNIEEGGSLTILATALVETGSTMDTVIFEEFKGTGNMELRLDRRLAEKRIYPAINVNESSTRHEELLFQKVELDVVWKLRRVLNGLAEGGSGAAGLELLMDRIKTTKTNSEFLMEIAKAPTPGN